MNPLHKSRRRGAHARAPSNDLPVLEVVRRPRQTTQLTQSVPPNRPWEDCNTVTITIRVVIITPKPEQSPNWIDAALHQQANDLGLPMGRTSLLHEVRVDLTEYDVLDVHASKS